MKAPRVNPVLRLAIAVLVLDTIGAAGVGISALTLSISKENQQTISQLVQENSGLLAQQHAATTSQAFVRGFVNEINYVCEVSTAIAKQQHLAPPSAGICSVNVSPTP